MKEQACPAGRVAAFFDFDGTLVRGDSILPFTRFLIRKRVPTVGQLLHLGWAVLLHHAEINTNDDVKRVFARQFAGHATGEIEALCREFCEVVLPPLVYRQARERLAEHRRQGHLVVIVSASLTVYLERFGRELGADIVVGTELEQQDGRYTGRLATPNCLREEKLRRLRALPGFAGIALADSFAYSDHHYDVPLLTMVGHPVLINPEPRLRELGQQRRWPVEQWTL